MQIIPDRDLRKADLIAGCPSKGQWYGKCKAVMCINRTIYFVALLIRIKRRGDGIVECTVRKWQIGAASGETERSVSDKRLPAGSRSDIKRKILRQRVFYGAWQIPFISAGRGKQRDTDSF